MANPLNALLPLQIHLYVIAIMVIISISLIIKVPWIFQDMEKDLLKYLNK